MRFYDVIESVSCVKCLLAQFTPFSARYWHINKSFVPIWFQFRWKSLRLFEVYVLPKGTFGCHTIVWIKISNVKIAWHVHQNAMAQLNPSDKENSPIKRKTLHTKSDVFQEVAHVFSCCHVTFLCNNNKLIRACPFSHFIIYLCICALCYEYIHKKRQRIFRFTWGFLVAI